MNITQQDIRQAEEAKEAIEDALDTLKRIARKSHRRSHFEAYVPGNLEACLENTSGFGNYSITDLIEDLNEQLLEEDLEDS